MSWLRRTKKLYLIGKYMNNKIEDGIKKIDRLVYKELKNDNYFFCILNKSNIDYYIDIGANHGLVYNWLVENNFNFKKSFLLEPHPIAYKELEKNVIVNNNVHLINKCFGDDSLQYLQYFKEHAQGSTKYNINANENPVESISLEYLVKTFEIDLSRTVIKCDCEGGEKWLLTEKNKTLLKDVYYITLEIHKKHYYVCDELYAFLKDTHLSKVPLNKRKHFIAFFLNKKFI